MPQAQVAATGTGIDDLGRDTELDQQSQQQTSHGPGRDLASIGMGLSRIVVFAVLHQ
jgi:hypothetical protein